MTYGKSNIEEFDEETQDSLHAKIAMDITDVSAEDATWATKVGTCKTQADFLNFFKNIGIPDGKWRSSSWLSKKAKLSKANGGIGTPLSGLNEAIRDRFGSHPFFVAWMDGKDKPDENWPDKVKKCSTPEDFLSLFNSLGITDDNWKNSGWLQERAKLPKEEKGIGIRLIALYVAIKNRFVGYPRFLAWMEGKDKPAGSLNEQVGGCETPEDFLALFKQMGIPDERWKTTTWLIEKSHLPEEKGGIGRNMSRLCKLINKRFGGHKEFVAWMEGKKEKGGAWTKKVKTCKSPRDFMVLFTEAGVTGDSWKKSTWGKKEASTIKGRSGLFQAIQKKFGSYKKFVAWMESNGKTDDTWAVKIRDFGTPDEFLAFFRYIGITGDQWKSTAWLEKKSHLPEEEGGIGKGLSVLSKLLRKRFGGHPKFVAWMEGNPMHIIDSVEEATNTIINEAARLGVPPEELLDPEKVSEYVRKSPMLKEVLNYFAAK